MVTNAYDALAVLTIISVLSTIGAAFNPSSKVFTRLCVITFILGLFTILLATKV